VKRVIGLPGDVVELADNRLTINGVSARYSDIEPAAGAVFAVEAYDDMIHHIEIASGGRGALSSFGPVMVPPGQYLVLGDNRDDSADSSSRVCPRDEIVGQSSTVVVSLDYDRHYLPRSGRFFHDL
jgi:signal peptidase I